MKAPIQIDQECFATQLFALLDETFENHHGMFLDKGTSLFETLKTITAAQASCPIGEGRASLAAHVAHVTFYLDVLERYILARLTDDVDWKDIWLHVKEVTPEEWADLKYELERTYRRVVSTLRGLPAWDGENAIGGALAIVVHTAYHLGAIRQAPCVVK